MEVGPIEIATSLHELAAAMQDVAKAIREHADAITDAGRAIADQLDALTNPDGEVKVRVFGGE